MDRSSNPNRVGSTAFISHSRRLIFIVDGANAVDSFVMRSKKTLNMVVPTVNTTMAYNSDDEEMVPDGLVEVAGLI